MANKIAFLDCDGVICDFTAYCLPYLAKHYGIEIPSNYIPKTWSMTDLAPPGVKPVDWTTIVPKDWCLHVKPFPGAKDFIDELKNLHGYHIVLITRIGQSRQIERMNNLFDNEIGYDEIYFSGIGQNKTDIIQCVLNRLDPDVWFFADDNGEAAHKATRECAKVYSLRYPYNNHVDDESVIWAKSEQDLYNRILEDADAF